MLQTEPKADAVHCARSAPNFAREELSSKLFFELMPMLKAHWAEIAHYQDIPLEPDQEAYERIAAMGGLRIFTIRMSGHTILGYAVFFLRPNMHYRSSLQATQDILFLTPVARGKLVGYRFIKWCDEQLRAEGVQVVYHHVKEAHNFGPMLERIGYAPVDRIYGRRLDKES